MASYPPLSQNVSFTGGDGDDEAFLRCWSRWDCNSCLVRPGCSWCPYSWTCVPNPHSIPFLAPIYDASRDDDVTTCPHREERWEIRARPFGCHVSSITAISSLASIVSTLLVLLAIWTAIVLARRTTRYGWRYCCWSGRRGRATINTSLGSGRQQQKRRRCDSEEAAADEAGSVGGQRAREDDDVENEHEEYERGETRDDDRIPKRRWKFRWAFPRLVRTQESALLGTSGQEGNGHNAGRVINERTDSSLATETDPLLPQSS